MNASPPRMRRQPPPFVRVGVVRTEQRTPHLIRVTVAGEALHSFEPPLPAGSVRLQIPDEPGGELVLPVWTGNAFFHTDGRRPIVRTLTPLRHDADAGELDVDVVVHEGGAMSEWAVAASPGDPAAFSGPGRGHTIDPDASGYLLAGDESALPAIGQLLEALPPTMPVTVIVEITSPDARVALSDRADLDVRWVELTAGSAPGSALVPAVVEAQITTDMRVWVAGEAAAVQRIRGHVFTDLGIPRPRTTIRGYWKFGRSSTEEDDDA